MRVVIGVIKFYQRRISVLTSPSCRFHPTCSDYCIEAVEKYGAIKGLWKGFLRICRCHPFNPGGFDPVN